MKKIVTIVGARPQFVKCAALRKVFDNSGGIDEVLVHTGQHYDFSMSEVFFQQLKIRKPDYSLGIGGKSHGAMTGEMLAEIEKILIKEKPDGLLVYGDTNSTLAGALAAAKLHIPVFHVEAGLRSFNRKMPEEINRTLADRISELLFCSTFDSMQNLKNEGIIKGAHFVGDIMYDVTKSIQNLIEPDKSLARYGVAGKKLAMCTIHRAENTVSAERLNKVVGFVKSFGETHHIVLPLHPGTAKKMAELNVSLDGLQVVDPLPYLETQQLLAASDLLLTDSGGMQKEAYFHKVECITLRDETEWVETVENGWNMLWTDSTHKTKQPISEYGEGDTAEKILAIIQDYFNNV